MKIAILSGAALLLALSVPVLAHGSGTDVPEFCAIQAVEQNGAMALQGVVTSPAALSGAYRFEVKAKGPSGSSNIAQGGVFAAKANEATPLGQVLLSSPGATYDVTLTIEANGTSTNCKVKAKA